MAYRICISSAIALSLLLTACIWHLGSNSMIACGFFGAFFIHVGARPDRKHIGISAAIGAAVSILYLLAGGHFGPDPLAAFIGAGAFLGIGSLMTMSIDIVWTGSRDYVVPLRDALILPVFALVAGLCMNFVNGRPLPSYDYRLWTFDVSLWNSPERTVAHWVQTIPGLRTAASITYSSLLIFPPLYHAWAAWRGAPRRMHLMNAFVVAGLCGFVLYQICPAIGPLYCFKSQFPDHLPSLSPDTKLSVFLSPDVHNAMPSMHITWALLVWWSAHELGKWAVAIASVFVVLTGISMIGSGEHYLVDVVVALPLILLVHGLCMKKKAWSIGGAALALGWLIFFRTGASIGVPGAVNWVLVAATLALSTWPLRRRYAVRTAPLREPAALSFGAPVQGSSAS